MLPPKNGKPITFKPTKELREQTEAIADSMGKSLSDYVRIAVETMNTHYQQNVPSSIKSAEAGYNQAYQQAEKMSAMISPNTCDRCGTSLDKNESGICTECSEVLRKTKVPKSTMVKTFTKGGK